MEGPQKVRRITIVSIPLSEQPLAPLTTALSSMLVGVLCGISSSQICTPKLLPAVLLMLAAVHFGYGLAYGSVAATMIPFPGSPDNRTKNRETFEIIASITAIPGPIFTGVLLHFIGRRPLTFFFSLFAVLSWVL
jgi:hypothetical protein